MLIVCQELQIRHLQLNIIFLAKDNSEKVRYLSIIEIYWLCAIMFVMAEEGIGIVMLVKAIN